MLEADRADLRWCGGLDWFQVTYTCPSNPEAALVAYETAVYTVAAAYDPTARAVPFTAQGYRGEKVGKASYGVRQDGCMLQVTGSWALHPALLAVPQTGVPRTDYAVTVWGLPRASSVPRETGLASRVAARASKRKPWQVTGYDGEVKGDTAYLGARTSETFVRVYDKGAQTDEPFYEGSVRYEVQSKNRHSQANLLYYSGGDNTAYRAASIVQRELRNKGVSLPDDLLLLAPEAPANPGKEVSSLDRTLQWLVSGVGPTVARLEAEGVPYELLHRLLFGRRHEAAFDDWGGRVVN
jgi:hypothetical protein